MIDNYTYPAILDYSEEGYISVEFVDFQGLVTCSDNEEDLINMAQDCLALEIRDYEERKAELPKPSASVEVTEDQKLVFINVWMPYHRSKIKETYVKKTLTIPVWLDLLAKNNNINFSAVLVKGLKEELGL